MEAGDSLGGEIMEAGDSLGSELFLVAEYGLISVIWENTQGSYACVVIQDCGGIAVWEKTPRSG